MQHALLSILLLLPLLAAVVALIIPKERSKALKSLATGVCGVQVLLVMYLFSNFGPGAGIQFIEKRSWIFLSLGEWGALKAEYFLGVDGLSLPLTGLAVITLLIASVSSWTIEKSPKGYIILFLIINAAIIGTFTALDLLLFYLFFEFMLLPMFFLIGIWGGKKREYASVKFFLYTLFGSILILIVLIGLYLSTNDPKAGTLVHSFNILQMSNPVNLISNSVFDPNNPWMIGGHSARYWAFLFLFIGFAIKLPMVPLHTWLPDAHVEAPTPVSVLLAALLLKIGGYGLLRIAYPIFPEAALHFSWMVALFGVTSIIWGALAAMASKDLKRLIAYSSVSHMGFVLLGIASGTGEGISGSVFQMVSHGILSTMLFLLAGVLYDRTNDRMIVNYSGLGAKLPLFFAMIIVAFFASMGLPGFSGFIGELLILLGAFKSQLDNGLLHRSFAIVAASGLVLSAAYFLWTIQRMFFGPFYLKGEKQVEVLNDLDGREKAMLIPLAIIAFVLGIFPQILLDVINPFAGSFVDTIFATAKNLVFNP